MPRSLEEILAQADDLADTFEAYEPRPEDRDTVSPVTQMRLAALKRAAAEREIAEAVAAARESHTPWKVIGAAVGTSGEAARPRYGRKHAS
ncbi:hypothetical protein J1G42_08825 [Cellulomonas sp. zg-ZUI222]|uniref:hypothetical protein n=1 Tax=Cellulomonas wangleii TaxID=2816956 RepID=UPI001A947960|nr:hypothetical protein [Cellulomonas wangleii]MBO0920928.1 hypothetical protein [Cellulomonas wangleii]